MNLTDRTIRTLATPEHDRRLYFDDEIGGFGLRVTAGGVKSFFLDYRFEGRQRRLTLGPWPDLTASAARDMAREARASIARGTDPLAVRIAKREAPDMATLCDDYLTHHAEAHKRARSIANDRSMVDRFIKPKLGPRKVAAVTARDIADLHRSLKQTPYQANRTLALVSKMMALAVAWGWRLDNPAKGVVKNREEARERALRPEETGRLVEAIRDWRARGERHARSADAIEMLLLTGARRSEVFGMRWDQLDLEAGVWTKPAAFTKQKKEHVVPLVEPAVAILRRIQSETGAGLSEWVFPGDKDGKPLQEVKKAWGAILAASGLEGVRLHDLRHSFATGLVEAGVGLELVGRLLGHTQAATTRRYAHPDVEALRAVADKARAAWEKPAAPAPDPNPTPASDGGNIVPLRRRGRS